VRGADWSDLLAARFHRSFASIRHNRCFSGVQDECVPSGVCMKYAAPDDSFPRLLLAERRVPAVKYQEDRACESGF
jgi:hypothetical protein